MAHLKLDNSGDLVSSQRDTSNAQLSINDNGELVENKSRKSVFTNQRTNRNNKNNKNLLDDGYQFGDFSKMFWNEAKEGANNLKKNIISLPGNAINTTKNILKGSEALQDGYQFGDISKTLGSTVLSTAQNFGEGVIRGGEQLVDAGADLFGGISDHVNTKLEKAIGLHKNKTESEVNKEKANSRKEMIATNYTDELMKAVGKDDEYKNLVESNSLIKSDNMGGAIAQELGRQSLNLLINNKVGSNNKVAQSIPMLAGSYGSGMEEAYQNGATTNEARRYGVLNAATETATEWVTGGIPGLKGSAGKGLDGLASKIIGEPIEETSKSLAKALLKSGYKLVGEGTEEALSELISPYIKQFTYEYNKGKNVLGNISEATSKISPQDMITSFIMGAITSGIIDAPNNLSDIKNGYINGKINKANSIQNSINNSTKNTTNLSDLQSSNINNQGSISSSQNGLNLANNNLLNNDINTLSKPAYRYTPSDNEKINNLRQSASKYFDNSANTQNLVNTFEKIIKDKNYNVVFDNTISNENGNQVNAQIKTLDNGETEIRINPNSDRAGEFLIMHEVTHAIETNSMKELVLDYASKNQEFNQALESLKRTYGTEDVSSEVLSDISGQLFGNQEFINNLSMEKPNIFKRIYNSIVSLANKITGNSKESLFIKDLKNKWEEAYRNTSTNQSVSNLNNDTKFSKGKLISGEDVIVSDDINGTHPSKQIAEQNLKSMLGIKYLNSNNNTEISIENKDIKKYLNDGYNNQKNMKLKKRISGNYGEILEIAQIDPNKSQSNYKGTNRGKQGFDYYDVNLAYPVKDNNGNIINYKYYESRLVVRKDNNNNFAYDLDGFKEKKGAVLDKTSLSIMADKSADGSFVENNIPQPNTNVKSDTSSTKYSMQKNINNTQELDNSSFSLLKNSDGKQINISNLKENSTMERFHYNRKYDKNNVIAYRGESENTGTNPAFYGLGLYTTLDSKYAKQYGNVSVIDNNLLPDNPLKFKTQNDFNIWEQELAKELGIRKRELYSNDYGVEQYIKKLGYDGLMIGSGKDTDLISFKDSAIKYSQEDQNWQSHLEKNYKATGTRTNSFLDNKNESSKFAQTPKKMYNAIEVKTNDQKNQKDSEYDILQVHSKRDLHGDNRGKSKELDNSSFSIDVENINNLTDAESVQFFTKENGKIYARAIGNNGLVYSGYFKKLNDLVKSFGKELGTYIYENSNNGFNEVKVKSKKQFNYWLNDSSNKKITNTDNLGRKLSDVQQEHFKNSKIRDDFGNLLTMYHGSENKFDVFKSDINWFTPSKKYSDLYGIKKNYLQSKISFLPSKSKYTYEVYLNVENPKILSNIDGYVSQEYDVNTFLNNSNLSKSQYEKILKEYNQNHTNDKAYHIYDLVNSKEFKNYLISEGYDGIIANEHGNTSCAVFNSNQIKNIKNSQPSDMLNINYSKENQTWQEHLEKNYKATGTRTNMKDYRLLPVPLNSEKEKINNNLKKQTIKEINQKKIDNNTNAINRLTQEKDAMTKRIEDKIKAKKELLKSKQNQDTKLATQLNIQISNLNNQLQNRKLDYDKRIEYYQNKNNKMNSEEFKIQEQRMTKKQEYIDQAYEMTENMIDWKDKDRGIKYKINTMKRNLYDIMPKLEADKMYNTYFQPITENNAKSENFINNYNERISKLELNNKESAAVQMLGEYKYNKETLVTGQQVDDYISDNKLNYDKISNAVEEFRNIYDELIVETNKVLKEQGYKEIEYRKGYFPHFQEETRQGKFAKLAEKLGFNTSKNNQTLPTDIAGMTEIFKPGKTYFKNAQQRKGKVTDYNALKGYDNYIRGAADLIFHTEDIQKLRALENVIRTQYTDASIQKRLEDIYNNEGLDQEQKQKLVDEEYLKINNSLPNFVTELRDYTDTLANKKDIGDRGMEHMLGRETYTIMKDVQSRVSANMVGFNISSALTNFIPITQAWGEVSTKNMFKAIRESIANQFHDDGFADCSTYLINRTKAADRLYKTKLEDINSKAGVIFEGIDSITSNAIVRGKYYDNIDKGMSQEKAIKNANEFAKDIMAGRSKGDMPTIFNRKSPVIKLFTAFQLEVNNQYGYMLKDLPRNLSDEAKNKLVGAFVKMFVGAWLYNKFSEAVVGRKSAFSPIDIASEAIQTVQGDSSIYDKLSSVSNSIVSELPFVGGIMGGGRLPIQAAIPDIGTTVESVTQLSDSSKRKKAIKNLTTELSKPIFYVAMPFGGGQLKKTIEGASMYTHNVPGSYTSTGKLRFTVKKDPLSVAQNLLFGQYSSKEAREYFNNGYAPLTEKQTKEFKELGVSMNTYRQYRTDLASLKEIKNDKDSNGKTITGSGTGKKAYQIMNNDKYTDKEKQYLLNNISSSEIKTSIKDLNKIANDEDVYKHYFSLDKDGKKEYLNAIEEYNFDSYQLCDYSQTKKKYEEQYTSSTAKEMVIDYLVSSNLSNEQKQYLYNKSYGSEENQKLLETFNIDIDNYLNTIKYSSELNHDYQGNEYSNYRKQQTFKYIQNLNASVIEKAVLFKKAGYSITSYKSYIYNYLNNLDISQSSKAELWNQLF